MELEALDEGEADEEAEDDLLELGEAQVRRARMQMTTPTMAVAPQSIFVPEDTSDLPREPSSPPPRVSTSGGTLFERMTNLSRGLSA